jgi:hypothetical protein
VKLPLILFGNKNDLVVHRLLSKKQILKFAAHNLDSVCEGSAKTGEKVNEAIQDLIRQYALTQIPSYQNHKKAKEMKKKLRMMPNKGLPPRRRERSLQSTMKRIKF